MDFNVFIHFYLLKCDQDKQGVVTNSEKMDEYVKEHGFAGWFETSAKENINIDEAARALVNKVNCAVSLQALHIIVLIILFIKFCLIIEIFFIYLL